MGTRCKGIYKAGFKYFSQIFVVKEEEEKTMEIGFPTDVKHVAHIGFDGPSGGNGPGWMTEFKTGPDFATSLCTPITQDSKATPKWSSQDMDKSRECQTTSEMFRDIPATDLPTVTKKQRRKKRSTSSLKSRSRTSRRSKATSSQMETKFDLED